LLRKKLWRAERIIEVQKKFRNPGNPAGSKRSGKRQLIEAAAWEINDDNRAIKWCYLQTSFFTEHLGNRGIEFSELVAENTTEDFYVALSFLASVILGSFSVWQSRGRGSKKMTIVTADGIFSRHDVKVVH
jgi:TorA maturation chaperone TorD